MAFIDELTIKISAGTGGDGVVRWRQEKFTPLGGPAGGNGGRGGDVFFVAVRDVSILEKHAHESSFSAQNGEAGRSKGQEGKCGDDLRLQLPVGAVITRQDTGQVYELTHVGQEIQVLRGGYGGYGNEHFKSSRNTTPYEWNPGQEGESATFAIELKLFADFGLVGFPNAGKSSLLNTLTNARSKVGSYPFTTLDPHLGVFFDYVIADIPGIIEGAHEGKGLGNKFLRHIARTRVLVHLVSLEDESHTTGSALVAYRTIRSEMELHNTALATKKEIVLLTKTDMVPRDVVDRVVAEFAGAGITTLPVTLFEDVDVKKITKELLALIA